MFHITLSFIFIQMFAMSFAEQQSLDSALISAIQKIDLKDKGIDADQLIAALENGVWNPKRTAVAASVDNNPDGTVAFVFLKQSNGSYLAVDVSQVERANFGALGIRPWTDYGRFETKPVKWWDESVDGSLFCVFRTRASNIYGELSLIMKRFSTSIIMFLMLSAVMLSGCGRTVPNGLSPEYQIRL